MQAAKMEMILDPNMDLGPKSQLVMVGDQIIAIKGFNMRSFCEYIRDRKWHSDDEFAKTMYSKNTKVLRQKARQHWAKANREFVKLTSHFLVFEYAPMGNQTVNGESRRGHGEKVAVRLFTPDKDEAQRIALAITRGNLVKQEMLSQSKLMRILKAEGLIDGEGETE